MSYRGLLCWLFMSIISFGGCIQADNAYQYIDQFAGPWIQGWFTDNYESNVVDGSGNLYVVDRPHYRFQKFSSGGTLIFSRGTYGTLSWEFQSPGAIAYYNNKIYISDGSNRIQIFDTNWNFVSQFGSAGSANGQFNGITAITIGNGDNVYVSDMLNYRVQIFDTDGNYRSQFGTQGSGPGQLWYFVSWIHISSEGNLYLIDNINYRIQIFNSSGTYISQFWSQGTADGQFLWRLWLWVRIGSWDNVYVLDDNNSRIQIFNKSGTHLSNFGIAGTADGQFGLRGWLTIAEDKTIYITDQGSNRVQRFDSNGNFISTFGSAGSGDGQFSSPSTINHYQWRYYITDAGNKRIQVIDGNGNYIWQSNGYTAETQGKLNQAKESAVYDNKVYVLDSSNYRVQIYNLSWSYLSGFGTQGSANGQFWWNTIDIAINNSGIIYIIDQSNNRIQLFNSSGMYLSQFWSAGSANGQFSTMGGIAIGSGNQVYVSDVGNNRIQIFNNSWTYLSQFWSAGSANGQFQSPKKLQFANNNKLYIADSSNYRIQTFDSAGTYLSQFGSAGIADNQFQWIGSVDTDKDSNIYIQSSTSTKKFDEQWNYINQFGSGGVWLSIDTTNNILYTTTAYSSTIKRYQYNIPIIQSNRKRYYNGSANPTITGTWSSWDIITIMSGDTLFMTGKVTSTNTRSITLPLTAKTSSSIFWYFITNSANNKSTTETLTLIVDTTPPIITLLGNTTMTVSQNSSFVDPGAIRTDATDGNWILSTGHPSGAIIDTSVVGTYYLTYQHTDNAGNIGVSQTRTVIVQSSARSGAGWGGGAGVSLVKDNCPDNQDYSASYYDRTCGTKPVANPPKTTTNKTTTSTTTTSTSSVTKTISSYSTKEQSNLCKEYANDGYSLELYNTLKVYKKEIFIICWMSDMNLTKFNQTDTFRWNQILRRDESTKFLTIYMKNVLNFTPDMTKWPCEYTDLAKGHSDLGWYMINACKYWLYDGSNNGKEFNPTLDVQAKHFSLLLAKVLILYNKNRWNTSYSTNFIRNLSELSAPNKPLTRMNAAHALYQLSKSMN